MCREGLVVCQRSRLAQAVIPVSHPVRAVILASRQDQAVILVSRPARVARLVIPETDREALDLVQMPTISLMHQAAQVMG